MKPISLNEIRSRASEFYNTWKDISQEKANASIFWHEFFNIFGISSIRVATYEKNVKLAGEKRGFIDLFWKRTLIVEHKSKGKDLDKAFNQAIEYFEGIDEADLPKYVIVSDFERIRLFDLSKSVDNYKEIHLKELSKNIHLFGFISGYETKKYIDEEPVNIKAASLMRDLHDSLFNNGYKEHDLETLLVRLLFCLFAEDTGIFNKDIFTWYIEENTKEDGSDTGAKLTELFEILNTNTDDRQENTDEKLKEFPFVNGSLYSERLRQPAFNSKIRKILIDCCKFDWSNISPIIFGSMFQYVLSTTNKRDNIGAHFTSENNITKVIDGLFLKELYEEFEQCKRFINKLDEFHIKIGKLKFLDTASGCGNFLITTYKRLRELELLILQQKIHLSKDKQTKTIVSEISIENFYGIEYEEAAVRISEVAMWLIEHQMNKKVEIELAGSINPIIPLSQKVNIIQGNSLRIDWNTLIPNTELNYIISNPPFISKQDRNITQIEDMKIVFDKNKKVGVLDYVCAWYKKAADYIQGTKIKVAFVSTNSIAQGEQVGILWQYLFSKNIKIHFAHRTFKWSNEVKGEKAHVYVVIIGLAAFDIETKYIYEYHTPISDAVEFEVKNINPYLIDYKDITIESRTNPICDVPQIIFGNMPNDGGNLIFTDSEKIEFIKIEPDAEELIKPLISAKEYLNSENRWCLWLKDVHPNKYSHLKKVMERINRVKQYRLSSEREATRKLAETPYLFGEIRQPNSNFILIPLTTSEHRKYIPISYLSGNNITNNTCSIIPQTTFYHFGILTSLMHMTWMRYVCGRLESRYRYSNNLVYNNFPFPKDISNKMTNEIEIKAKQIIDVRNNYDDATLSDLYNPNTMPKDLNIAHQELDKIVDKCYGKPFKTEMDRIATLFDLYLEYTKK